MTKPKKKTVKDHNKLLVEKEFTKWLRQPNHLTEDIAELSSLVMMFDVKYGIKLKLVYEK